MGRRRVAQVTLLVCLILIAGYIVGAWFFVQLYKVANHHLKDFQPILGTIINATLAAIGVVFSLFTVVFVPAEAKRIEMKLRYVEDQLKTLYGPLLGECLQSDSTFRRVELAICDLYEPGEKQTHRHYNLRELCVVDFPRKGQRIKGERTETGRRQLFAKALRDIYMPANKRRLTLLQQNLDLLGPNPPLSLALFMAHATQLESLLLVKQSVDLASADATLDRYKDPYILAPFPAHLTGEVIAKVAWLKALQREYRFRLARSRWPWNYFAKKQVYRRDQYFLLLNEQLRDSLNLITACHETRRADQTAFHPHTFPLVWGPYVAVELFELRTWLISREIALRNIDGFVAEHAVLRALIQAEVLKYDKKQTGTKHKLHYRVAQLFDELDKPGSKKNFAWTCDFNWETLKTDSMTLLEPLSKVGFSLQTIMDAPEIAYDKFAYEEMIEMYSGRED